MMTQLIEMAAKQVNRLTIEIGDLRNDIENCRSDDAWKELSLSAKIRVLIKAGLKVESESEKAKQKAE